MNIRIPTNVSIPDSLEVNLVNPQMHTVAQIFSILFNIFIAFFSALLGHGIGNESMTIVHWLLLIPTTIFSLLFLKLMIHYQKSSLYNSLSHNSISDDFPIKMTSLLANILIDHEDKAKRIITDLGVSDGQQMWRDNKSKKTHKTLRIYNIDNTKISSILTKFDEENVDVQDVSLRM